MRQPEAIGRNLNRIQWSAAIVGVAGVVGLTAGALYDADQFFQSYLFAYMFWLGIALGGLAISLLYHLVGGAWGFVVRRVVETAAMTIPLMLILFAPVVLGMGSLYEWTRAEVVARDSLIQAKSPYLNTTFFLIRAAGYFAIWGLIAYFLNRWSLAQDRTADPALSHRLRLLSRVGLMLYVLTISFAAIDWVMSLEPHWFSSIFGVLFIAGQGLTGMAFAIAMTGLLGRRGPLADAVTPARFNDLGNLLLAFVMFWAYINLSQFLIIWMGNLPEEVTWYEQRNETSWVWIILFVLAFQFVLPFLLLLARATKRSILGLGLLAAAILAVHLLELFWRVAPTFHEEGLVVHWLDIVAPIAIGGVWVAAFAWMLKGRPLIPLHDPYAPRLEASDHD
jgi:hypothetical protein